MRKYILPEWKYAVETSKSLSKTKKYAERFRHDYFVLLGTKKGFGLKFASFLFGIVVYLNDFRHILTRQLAKTNGFPLNSKYNFYIANNPSYLKTVIPVAEKLVQNKEEVAMLCSSNNYNILRKTIKPELVNLLYVIESANIANFRFKALLIVMASVVKSLLDGLWFVMQPLHGRFFFSTDFMKYGLSNYCYDKYWQHYFNEKKRYLMAANEFHHWESLLFEACRDTISQSIILAHGMETEISYPIFAKKRFTWGSHDVDLLVNSFGAAPSEVEAVGSPYFDRIYDEIQPRKKLIPSLNKEFIIFFGQPCYKAMSEDIEEYNHALEWFYKLAKSSSTKRFMIKLHPFDDIEYYSRAPENVVFSKENILLSLEKCFIMLTVDSNSILEAAVFGIPAIQCISLRSKIFIDYSNSGVSVRASDKEELIKLVAQLSVDDHFYNETTKRSNLAIQNYFANLGRSLDVIIEKIK